MVVDIAKLPPAGRTFEGEEPAEVLDIADRVASADGPVRYRITACVAGSELVARGRVSAMVRFVCVRCATVFECEVVEDAFLRTHRIEREGECVDLTPEMREAILLAFPHHPVCREGCRGLCPRCGADMNVEQCSCPPPSEPRWAAFDGLKAAR